MMPMSFGTDSWHLLAAVLRVPVDIPRGEARDAAQRELSKRMYQRNRPGLLQRVADWLFERLQDVLNQIGGGNTTYGVLGVAVIFVIVLLIVLALRLGLGPLSAARRTDDLFGGRVLTAAEHRAAAEKLASAGEWAQAIRERLRAIIRELEQRGLLDHRPGRTADEAAVEAGRALPACADGLREAARVFDDVWYGERTATGDMYDQLRRLDEAVRTSRPALARDGV